MLSARTPRAPEENRHFPVLASRCEEPREVVAGFGLTAPAVHSRGRRVAPRADVSERGGPGLPGPGDRTTPSEPSCPNHGGVRALSPAGHANDGGTTGLRAPPGIAIPIAPLQPRSHRGPGSR